MESAIVENFHRRRAKVERNLVVKFPHVGVAGSWVAMLHDLWNGQLETIFCDDAGHGLSNDVNGERGIAVVIFTRQGHRAELYWRGKHARCLQRRHAVEHAHELGREMLHV
ncbi:hypothetical protein ATCV1_z504L [Acanthocystis turfacea chlorella virus 1]|uniref:Uncharacterized protein z504L n=1 Tax=Chlorovirus heliozoae TaxID=322019 RepID=A7K9B4_9PHYC|nr:hypothetical protein ATCV1_z504L [Acanthocystis turfacea chlorella virus 1]ABT16638.1 hypothetical protein ATCV1_z504L [Acanthocystis turfacea chlorella virus 1]